MAVKIFKVKTEGEPLRIDCGVCGVKVEYERVDIQGFHGSMSMEPRPLWIECPSCNCNLVLGMSGTLR